MVVVSQEVTKTPDEIQADEVLCHIGRALSPEYMHCYSSWARVWNPINLVRFAIKDQMTTSVFNRVWARVTRELHSPVGDACMRQVQESCGDASPGRVGKMLGRGFTTPIVVH